jgi:hypothetical protein
VLFSCNFLEKATVKQRYFITLLKKNQNSIMQRNDKQQDFKKTKKKAKLAPVEKTKYRNFNADRSDEELDGNYKRSKRRFDDEFDDDDY